jgi:predicted aldo/keto reductase-like oxidoreductase
MCKAMKNEKSLASQCKKCGKCESHCPKGIKIREELVRVKRRFENPIFKLGTLFAPKIR